jgi:hypothetical protein
MKKFLKNLIRRMAAENEKTFGTGKLDCCDLNKSSNPVTKNETKTK